MHTSSAPEANCDRVLDGVSGCFGGSSRDLGDGPWGIGGAEAPCRLADASSADGGTAPGARAANARGADDTGTYAPPPMTRAALLARLRSQVAMPAAPGGGNATSAAAVADAGGRGRGDSNEFDKHGAECSGSELACRRNGQIRVEAVHAVRGGGAHAGGGGARPLPAVTVDDGDTRGQPTHGAAMGNGASVADAASGGLHARDDTAPEASQPRAVPRSATAARGSVHSAAVTLASGAVPARRRIVGKQRIAAERSISGDGSASPLARTTPSYGMTFPWPPGRPPESLA